MAVDVGIVASLSYRESSGSPGSYTVVLPNLFEFPEPTLSPETLPIADGIDLRVRDRDEFLIRVHDISLWSALNTLMVARAKLDLKFTMSSGKTYTFNPNRFTVRPLFNRVPDRSEILIGATDAGNDVGDADAGDWTSLGNILDGSTLDLTPNTRNDGIRLGFFTSMGLQGQFDFIDDAGTTVRTTLATYNRLKCKLAILSPDGNYLILSGITLQHVPYALNFGVDQLVTDQVIIGGVAANATSLVTLPASPPDYIYGFELRTMAASAVQGDYLTVAGP